MASCPACTQGTLGRGRFGANLVTFCDRCHALSVEPITDPRLPAFEDHVRQLQEEIRLEEEEGDTGKEITCRVESSGPHPLGARLQVQVVGGNARWVITGSRVESHVKGEDERCNVEVLQRTSSHFVLASDDKRWADLRTGLEIVLRPSSNATLYRNLLKAFLQVRKLDPAWTDLTKPENLPKLPATLAEADTKGLTAAQAQAVRAALSVPDEGLMMVQGPPGTGKTTVIARFLREAIRRNKRVLVTSHTHVAIDNALRKALKDEPRLGEGMIRLGESGRVAADLLHLNERISSFHFDPEEPDSKPLFAALQGRARIVGMTLDALACALWNVAQKDQVIDRFDYVIVDEAGMNGYPKLAIAHTIARRMILVGDPLQLPPIVRARSFRNNEHHKRSHFESLQMMRTDLSVLLDMQFRCDPRIYSWSEGAIYGGRVHSGAKTSQTPWTVLGRPAGPVVWVDTKGVHNRAERVGSSWANPFHLQLAQSIAMDLTKQGLHPADLGYITPFRAQAEAWAQALEDDKKLHPLVQTTASTVDAFQGSEREAVIVDLTTPVPAKPHEDHRRLNVSLTRAQKLLIILGPRPYVRAATENPYLWSLQNWAEARTVPAPLP